MTLVLRPLARGGWRELVVEEPAADTFLGVVGIERDLRQGQQMSVSRGAFTHIDRNAGKGSCSDHKSSLLSQPRHPVEREGERVVGKRPIADESRVDVEELELGEPLALLNHERVNDGTVAKRLGHEEARGCPVTLAGVLEAEVLDLERVEGIAWVADGHNGGTRGEGAAFHKELRDDEPGDCLDSECGAVAAQLVGPLDENPCWGLTHPRFRRRS